MEAKRAGPQKPRWAHAGYGATELHCFPCKKGSVAKEIRTGTTIAMTNPRLIAVSYVSRDSGKREEIWIVSDHDHRQCLLVPIAFAYELDPLRTLRVEGRGSALSRR